MLTIDEITEQALQLSFDQRVELIRRLLRTLDPPGSDVNEDQWIAAWQPELERRAVAMERGEVQGLDWRESLDRVRRSLRPGVRS